MKDCRQRKTPLAHFSDVVASSTDTLSVVTDLILLLHMLQTFITHVFLCLQSSREIHGFYPIPRLECPVGHLPLWRRKTGWRRSPLKGNRCLSILQSGFYVWLVFVHARVFMITADSNARRYWLSTNGFVTK